MSDETATAMYRARTDALTTDVGEGQPVVFAHGTLMDRTMFAPQLEALRDEYRAVAYDLRARTDRYAPGYDLWDLADDCDALLDGIGEDSAVIAGMSMGGFMGLRFALEYPERVDGLILIDSMATPHPEDERAEYEALVEPYEDTLEPMPREIAEGSTAELFGETTHEETPELVEAWVDRWATYPGRAVHYELNSWLGREDVTDRLSEIDVPVLIVHGEEDPSIAPAQAEPMLEELPDAEMELIPEAGHTSNLEGPDETNEAIRSFLDERF
ncbi:alpha/beta hydrolase [Natrinema thermotolerans]|uniref:Alpha/beta hydrolase n=1 Tax=Natrinema thermotolerans TaxID=121872 RepID=A0AAF0PFQ4_9EURY|nr:alpha/beta hydrolase [Natrinema thermotolerans]QCC57570.1 alpha/beta hydrolase [Natrinema thermotolerans]WMT08649.1 alpha/beta hydrolase [Natrinema thermotolerans]